MFVQELNITIDPSSKNTIDINKSTRELDSRISISKIDTLNPIDTWNECLKRNDCTRCSLSWDNSSQNVRMQSNSICLDAYKAYTMQMQSDSIVEKVQDKSE